MSKELSLPSYEGRVISVSLRGDECTVKLVDPRWATIAGRLFLVGRWADHPERPQRLAGVEASIAWDDINHFLLFDSEVDYIKRFSDLVPMEPPRVQRVQ